MILGLSFFSLAIDQIIGYDKPNTTSAQPTNQAQPNTSNQTLTPKTANQNIKPPTHSNNDMRRKIAQRLETLNVSYQLENIPVSQAFNPRGSWIPLKNRANSCEKIPPKIKANTYVTHLKLDSTMSSGKIASASINGTIIDQGQTFGKIKLLKVSQNYVLLLTPAGKIAITIHGQIIPIK